MVGKPARLLTNRMWYAIVQAAAIVLFSALCFALPPALDAPDFGWMTVWVALIVLGVMVRIQVGAKTKMGVAFTPMYASTVLLGPVLGMAVAAIGTSIAFALRPFGTLQTRFFNIATLALSAGLSGAVGTVFGQLSLSALGASRAQLASILLTGVVFYLANSMIVAISVDLREGHRILNAYLRDQSERLPNYLLLGAFGAFAGVYGEDHTVALVLAGIPMAIAGAQFNQFDRLREKFLDQALYDPLTKLANRATFADELERALRRSNRRNRSIAAFYLDLDGFKAVNDTYGHQAGDTLLVSVAERIRDCLRQEDFPSRLGGDEFAILLDDPVDVSIVSRVATRLIDQIRAPYDIDGNEALISVSIGVAFSEPGVDTGKTLLKRADEAMYQAKVAGKSRFRIAGAELDFGAAPPVAAPRRAA